MKKLKQDPVKKLKKEHKAFKKALQLIAKAAEHVPNIEDEDIDLIDYWFEQTMFCRSTAREVLKK